VHRLKSDAAGHSLAVQIGAVGAAQIHERYVVALLPDFGVQARSKRVADADVVSRRPPDSHSEFVERNGGLIVVFWSYDESGHECSALPWKRPPAARDPPALIDFAKHPEVPG